MVSQSCIGGSIKRKKIKTGELLPNSNKFNSLHSNSSLFKMSLIKLYRLMFAGCKEWGEETYCEKGEKELHVLLMPGMCVCTISVGVLVRDKSRMGYPGR